MRVYMYRRCSNRQTIDKYTCPEDARFRRGEEAVTGGYKARYIGGILRAVVSACRPRLVRFARHNIWNCRRERWQARFLAARPVQSPIVRTRANLARAFDLAGCCWRSREINSPRMR